jgi:hypothetical protein
MTRDSPVNKILVKMLRDTSFLAAGSFWKTAQKPIRPPDQALHCPFGFPDCFRP